MGDASVQEIREINRKLMRSSAALVARRFETELCELANDEIQNNGKTQKYLIYKEKAATAAAIAEMIKGLSTRVDDKAIEEPRRHDR